MLIIGVGLWFWHCPFRYMGLSCPGCGMSTAILTALKSDLSKAFYFHPLWPLVVVIVLYLIIKFWFGKGFNKTTETKLLIILGSVFLGVYLYRLLVIDSPIVRFILNK